MLRKTGSLALLVLLVMAGTVSLSIVPPAHASGGSLCPTGTTFNSSTNQCQASPTCSANLTFNSADNKCEVSPSCPTGTSLSNGICTGDASTLCPSDTTFVSGVGCEATPSCPSGYAPDASGRCQDGGEGCPSGFDFAVTGLVGYCFDGAPPCATSTAIVVDGVCVLNGPTTCPSGYTMLELYASGAGPCTDGVPTCSTSGDSFSTSTGLCEPSGATPNCPSGTDYIFKEIGSCIYQNTVVCPSSTDYFSGGECIYQNEFPDVCPSGTTVNYTGECVGAPACPAGTSFDGTSSCTGSAQNFCPSGTTFNSGNSECQSTPICPTGTAFNATSHECLLQIINIAIKPLSSPSPINIKKGSIVTVAILGSSSFSVYAITSSPLSAAPKFGGSTPQSPVRATYQDVNNDGITDLVLQFQSSGLGFTTSSTQGCVSGTLAGGTPLLGCAPVKIIS